MRQSLSRVAVLPLACLLMAFLHTSPVFADPSATPSATHTAVMLLLDRSGSMRSSDPRCVRAEAAQLLVAQLKEGDLISLVEFGDAPRPMTRGFESVTAESRARLAQLLKSCGATDGNTDVWAALNIALLQSQSIPEGQRQAFPLHVVLLTDGRHDPVRPHPSDSERIRETLVRLRQLGVTVHGLGLGPGVDSSLLADFSILTGGHVGYAESPVDLVAGFLEFTRFLGRRWLLEDRPVKPGESLRVPVPGWATKWHATFVPSVADQGTVSFGGKAPDLVQPNYAVATGETAGQDLEVSASRPGRLLVDATGDLALSPEFPSAVPPGVFFRCQVRLVSPANRPLGTPRFLDGATVRASGKGMADSILYDDGQHEDGSAGDGVLAGRCLAEGAVESLRWAVTLATLSPTLESPRASGTTRVIARPLTLTTPGTVARLMSAAIGAPSSFSIGNDTDIALGGTVHVGGRTVSATVPPHGSSSLSIALPYAMTTSLYDSVHFEVLPNGARFDLGGAARLPQALPYLISTVFVVLLIGVKVFPRRSAEGSALKVQVHGPDDDTFSATGRVDANGVPQFKDPLPDPLDRPGVFRGVSGLWWRGVRYQPASWASPVFASRMSGSGKSGYRISRIASWTCHHGAYKVTYTLTPSRR